MLNKIETEEIKAIEVVRLIVDMSVTKRPIEKIDAFKNAHLTTSLLDLYIRSGNDIAATNDTGIKKL